jgi:hypothetical protein
MRQWASDYMITCYVLHHTGDVHKNVIMKDLGVVSSDDESIKADNDNLTLSAKFLLGTSDQYWAKNKYFGGFCNSIGVQLHALLSLGDIII